MFSSLSFAREDNDNFFSRGDNGEVPTNLFLFNDNNFESKLF